MSSSSNIYEKFCNYARQTTKILVFKAIDIYHLFRINQRNKVNFSFKVNEKDMLTSIEQCCASLFLAGLLVEGPIRHILLANGIDEKEAFSYFGIKKKRILSLSDESHRELFDEEFIYQLLLRGLKGGIENISPYDLIGDLCDEKKCGSEIIKKFYQSYNLEAANHPSFRSLEKASKLEKKLNVQLDYVEPKILNEIELDSLREQKNLDNYQSCSPKSYDDHFSSHSNNFTDYDDSLLNYGFFLTDEIIKDKEIFGREEELRKLQASLLIPGNAILVGKSGVGKTSMVYYLAHLLKQNKVPTALKNKRIFSLDVASIIAGSKYRGDVEGKIKMIMSSLEKNENTILFVDEIHMLMGMGYSDNGMNLSNLLKPYLSRETFQIIGATTEEEYQKYIMSDDAFRRHFVKITINELKDNTIMKDILEKKSLELKDLMKVNFENMDEVLDVLIETTDFAHRDYYETISNPTLAINILARAFSYAALENEDILSYEKLAQAIEDEENLNKGSRNSYAEEIKKLSKEPSKVLTKAKIISFPKR